MKGKHHTPEQAEVELGSGLSVAQVCQKLAVSEQTFYRWKSQYGGMKADQLEHALHQPLLLGTLPGLQALGGPGLVQHAAGPALGDVEGGAQVQHGASPPVRAQEFPRATSLSICRSNACSATIFFSRAFSASSSLRRFIWSAFMPPYWLFQR